MTNLILKINTTSAPIHVGTLGMSIPGENGADGREVELRKSDTHVQWKYVEDAVWTDIIALADLKGEKGEKGLTGDIGPKGDSFTYSDFTQEQLDSFKGTDGTNGITPHIGVDGNWYVGEIDTGIRAAGTDGTDGVTPHIDADGYWYVGQVNTGIKAVGVDGTNGKSAYEGAVDAGYVGTSADFYSSLTSVKTDAEVAQQNAQEASQSKTDAANSASTATTKAQEASASAADAQQAAQVASDAQQAINTAEPARVLAEQERAAAEEARVTAEQERQDAINAKLDKTSVINDLTTGGTTVPLSAEQGKALSASISELKADVDFNVTNLVTNGNFANGTTGWTGNNATLSATSNTLTVTCSGAAATCQARQTCNAPFVASNKIFMKALARVTNANCAIIKIAVFGDAGIARNIATQSVPAQNKWYSISGVFASTSDSGLIRTQAAHEYADTATANGKVMEVKEVMLIDLTATFGAGNEPTAAEMDAMLAFYPNSWFDGTVNLASNPKMLPYLLNSIRSKADKEQEAWAYPTLTNSWVAADTQKTPRYRKDALGRVTIEGAIKSGTLNASAFILPSGYRPSMTSGFTAYNSTGSGLFYIDVDGRVYPKTRPSTSDPLYISCSFFAA